LKPVWQEGLSVADKPPVCTQGTNLNRLEREGLQRGGKPPFVYNGQTRTERQVQQYRLPTIIKRDRRYTDGRPHEAVETEALKQTTLVGILRRCLDAMLPEALDRVLERERRQRRRIAMTVKVDRGLRVVLPLYKMGAAHVGARTRRARCFTSAQEDTVPIRVDTGSACKTLRL
jgi:hypothetical protein